MSSGFATKVDSNRPVQPQKQARVLLNDHLFGKELFILFAASAFRKLPSIYVFSYFPFGFEGRIWDLIASVPDHCLSFYFEISDIPSTDIILTKEGNNKGADKTERMRRLIGAFVVRIRQKQVFS